MKLNRLMEFKHDDKIEVSKIKVLYQELLGFLLKEEERLSLAEGRGILKGA